MTDRPILFSAPMVRALLAGTKTQTRRIVKPQLAGTHARVALPGSVTWDFHTPGNPTRLHGSAHLRFAVGDRLWVREAWRTLGDGPLSECTGPKDLTFRATDPEALEAQSRYRPGIHLARWGSRLTLHVTDVRVQRLQEITPADCRAEGHPKAPQNLYQQVHDDAARDWYMDLWTKINGAGSWDLNPWVVAITFTVEKANIGSARP